MGFGEQIIDYRKSSQMMETGPEDFQVYAITNDFTSPICYTNLYVFLQFTFLLYLKYFNSTGQIVPFYIIPCLLNSYISSSIPCS